MKRFKKTGWLWAGLALILMAGTYLRLVNLVDSAYNAIEIPTVFNAHTNYVGEESISQPAGNLQDFIFSKVIQYSYTVFGENELAARSVNIVIGGMLVIMMFFIGWRFFHKGNAGIIAAFITAFHPMLIDFSRIATIHNSRFFLLTFLVYAFYEGIEGTRDKHPGLLAQKAKLRKFYVFWNLDLFWLAVAVITFWSTRLVFPRIDTLLFGLSAYCIVLFLMQFVYTVPKAGLKWKYGVLLIVLLVSIAFLKWNVSPIYGADVLKNAFTPGEMVDTIFLHPSNWTLTAFALIGGVYTIINMQKPGFYILTIFISSLILAHFQARIDDYFFIFPLYLALATYGVFEFAYYIRRQLDVQLITVNIERRLHITPQRLVMGFFLAIVILTSPWFRSALDWNQKNTLLYEHVPMIEWKQIGEYLRQNQTADEPVVTPNPLLTRYYGLNGKYYQIDVNALSNESIGDSLHVHDALHISTIDEFKQVVAEYEIGWLVLEESLRSEILILQFINASGASHQLEKKFETPRKTAQVYSWRRI